MQLTKRTTQRLITVLVSVTFTLILTELFLRLTGFEFNLYPMRVEFGWPDPITLKYKYQIDQDLLWIPKNYPDEIDRWKAKRPSIVFMGCSCTEFGVYDTYLKDLFDQKKPDHQIGLLNAGVGGWSSYQGLQQLRRDIVPLQPKLITVYYGWNDHWVSFGMEDSQIGRFNREQPKWLLMANKLRIVQLAQSAIAKPYQTDPAAPPPPRVSLEDFKSNLTEIVAIARSHGIVPVLLTAPTTHQEGHEPKYLAQRWLNDLNELVPLHRAYTHATREVARNLKVPLVDLAKRFDDLFEEDSNQRGLYFQKDGIHPTPKGDRMIAQILYDYFEKHQFLDLIVK